MYEASDSECAYTGRKEMLGFYSVEGMIYDNLRLMGMIDKMAALHFHI